MNINMPAFNPVIPTAPNPVIPTPTDRQGGGGTAVEMDTARPVADARQTEQGNPNPGQNTAENTALNPPQASNTPAVAGRTDSALAAEARLQVAREGSEAPQGFGVDPARLSQVAANETPQTQMNEPQAAQQGPNGVTARPDTEQMAMQQRLEQRLERGADVVDPQARDTRTLSEMV